LDLGGIIPKKVGLIPIGSLIKKFRISGRNKKDYLSLGWERWLAYPIIGKR